MFLLFSHVQAYQRSAYVYRCQDNRNSPEYFFPEKRMAVQGLALPIELVCHFSVFFCPSRSAYATAKINLKKRKHLSYHSNHFVPERRWQFWSFIDRARMPLFFFFCSFGRSAYTQQLREGLSAGLYYGYNCCRKACVFPRHAVRPLHSSSMDGAAHLCLPVSIVRPCRTCRPPSLSRFPTRRTAGV